MMNSSFEFLPERVLFNGLNRAVGEVDLLQVRQLQLLEEVGRDFRQVVVGEVEDLSVAIDDARDRRQRRIDAFDGLKIKNYKF